MPTDADPRSDAELLAASRRDVEAFGVFYQRHVRAVLGAVARRTGDPELAADIASEAFAEAMLSSHRYDARRGDPTAWLFGIVRNTLAASARLQVIGPALGEHRWVDGGDARQIAGGYAFSGFYLRDHHWLQLVLTPDAVARVKLALTPAGGPVTSRTVTRSPTWWRRSSASTTGRRSSPPTTRMAACSTANTSPITTA